MAAILWTDVSECFAELATAPLAMQMLALVTVNGGGLAADNFDGEAGTMTRTARIFLAAHIATLAMRRGQAGAISSQSEGGVSQSYGLSLANPRVLDLTSYGNLFRQLVMGTGARAGLLVRSSCP